MSAREFVHHANSLLVNGFLNEFNEIENDLNGTVDFDKEIVICNKNRFLDIPFYDHSRVKLSLLYDIPFSDFINANYVDGYNLKNQFIATQGPLEITNNDFWKMIWEQDVGVIVMLTNPIENATDFKYFPVIDNQTSIYGRLEITKKSSQNYEAYVFDNYKIKNQDVGSLFRLSNCN